METLVMSARERRRLEVVGQARRKEITLVKASELLGLSYRHMKRLMSRYRSHGDRGLVHGLRGRPSNRRQDGLREQVLAVYAAQYVDFGPTLATEYLQREDGLVVSVETLRQWLLAAGLWQPRRRRRMHRCRRLRKAHVGELVQMDGSFHDWFEGRRAWAVLMVMIDDASGRVYARFFEGETTTAALEIFGQYTRHYGLPQALYVDRDSIYRTDREATRVEALAGQEPRTQFGRAMEDLGVRVILAGSPQAKGRVERCNGTLQDRLVKALRHEQISDLLAANAFLESVFLADFNRRFAVAPAELRDLHRRVPANVKLERVLALQEERLVQNDGTVRWHNRWLQISQRHRALGLIGRRVTVCQCLDGEVIVTYGNRALQYEELPGPPAPVKPTTTGLGQREHAKPQWRPGPDHPWRRKCVG